MILSFISKSFHVPLFILKKENEDFTNSLKIPGYSVRTIGNENEFHKTLQNKNRDKLLELNRLLKQTDNYKKIYPIMLEKHIFLTSVSKNQYTYKQMKNDLNSLLTHYPFIHYKKFGQSRLKKDLIELSIGEGKKQVHFNASFHGNEWISTIVLIEFLVLYLQSLTNTKAIYHKLFLTIFKNTTLSIVPMVNPDGVDLAQLGIKAAGKYKMTVIEQNFNKSRKDFSKWKANIAGVDLNKQFPANWHYESNRKVKKNNYRDFPGYAPLTEPESISMSKLVRDNAFERIVCLHTQGEEIYWYYPTDHPIRKMEKHTNILAALSNYRPVKHLDNYAGFKDWFIKEFQKEGYTVELGLGENPLPLSQLTRIKRNCIPLLIQSLLFETSKLL